MVYILYIAIIIMAIVLGVELIISIKRVTRANGVRDLRIVHMCFCILLDGLFIYGIYLFLFNKNLDFLLFVFAISLRILVDILNSVVKQRF